MEFARVVLRLAIAALLTAHVGVVRAQSAGTGALAGVVTDPSGAAISGATVRATNNQTGRTRATATDNNGAYKFSLLPPANYRITFSKLGFKT